MANRIRLKREIGLFGATAIGVGAIVGSGIFIITGILAGFAGPALVISILLAGLIIAFSAVSIAGLAAFLPCEGGTYAYARVLISPFAGYLAGWVYVFSKFFVGAALSLGFANYLGSVYPGIPVTLAAVLICVAVLVVNYLGIRRSAIINSLLVIVTVIILVFFITCTAGSFKLENFFPFAPGGPAGIMAGASLMFFASTRFVRLTVLAEEIKDPKTTIPRAIFFSLVISTLLYLLVGLMATGIAGTEVLSTSVSPLTTAVVSAGCLPAARVISAGAMIAMAGVLLTTVIAMSRVMYAMGRNDDLPVCTCRLHPRYATPHYAIAITGACTIAAIMVGDMTLVIGISTFAMLIYFVISNLCALRIPREKRQYPCIIPVIGLCTCIVMMVFLDPFVWMVGFAGIGMGIAVHLAQEKWLAYQAGQAPPGLSE